MSKRFDIAVVGAGVTGLSIAALLAQSEHADALRIRVIDAAERPRWQADDDVTLRVSAISCGSAELLAEIGAWSEIESSRYCPYDHMCVWDESDAPESASSLRFDADEFAVKHLGYIVENVLLQNALLNVLDAMDVDVCFETPFAGLQDSGADLLIGADGARSVVREAAGIEVHRHSYDQTAFVTHLTPDHSHRQTAWQRFLRNGPLGMLPLADGRISVVWSTSPESADAAMQCSDDELGQLLSAASGYVLGALAVSGGRATFPLAAQHAQEYVMRGIALIGDAAHTVHPLAGQGANLGLQDARELASVIAAALDAGEHPADRPVLRRYERARKGANATMMHFMTGLNRLFAADSPVLSELRRTGMQLFTRSGPVRKHVVGVALGAGRP